MALLSTNELMAGAQIKEFLFHLVSSNTNMSFVGTNFGSGLRQQGQLYWDYLMGAKNVNNAQKAKDVKDIAKHI
jgi:hypothetical protein